MANCQDAIEHLYQYLDRELSATEQADVQQHLDRCPPCLGLFRFEENILRFVGEKCRQTAAPPALRDRVRKLCQES
jgi:mycothiol system anti-sigma-R factor